MKNLIVLITLVFSRAVTIYGKRQNNADNSGEMQVVVEAISDKGEIGYKELDFKVKKKE